MATQFRLPRAAIRRLEELQLSPQAVLRRAGLSPNLFEQDKPLVSTREFFAFYRAIEELSSDPIIGLRMAEEDRFERYDPIAIAALCTRTFRDAVERVARYKQLTCPEKIEIAERGDECAVRFKWLLADEEEPAVLVDLCFSWMITIARRGMGHAIHPKRVEFQRAQGPRTQYEAFFQCPVRMKSRQNVLFFHKQDMDAPFLTHNAELLAMVAPQLEAELRQQLDEKHLREQVKGVLKRLIAGRRPGLSDVARELRLSTRTLQRRLTEERATFQQLMEEARRELARHYLQHSSLELNETAYLLGYEDANSFFRAFHAWEGTTPGQWRASRAPST